jgi:hypothetical protein
MSFHNPSKPGENQNKKIYFSIKQGKNIFRIFPSLDGSRWSTFYSIHFGEVDTKGKMRVFQSCEVKNRKTKMVEVEDPRKTWLNTKNEEYKKFTDLYKKAPSEALKAKIEAVKKDLGFTKEGYSTKKLENKNFMLAMDLDGNVGLLQLKYKEKLALDEARKKIEIEDGVDPIGIKGCYLEFNKTGNSFDTIVTVTGHQLSSTVNGKTYKELNTHEATDADAEKIKNSKIDLNDLYVTLSQEEIQHIMDHGPKGVDEVWAKFANKEETSEGTEEAPEAEEHTDPPAPKNVPKKEASTPKTEPKRADSKAPTQPPVGEVTLTEEERAELEALGVL